MATSDRLDYLRDSRALRCTRCGLHRNRNHLVFGSGDPDADIVILGEGPGADENRSGEPFVGPAGQLLDGFLRRAELPRESVYICNVVKCQPPGNRDPEPEEVAACAPFLHLQLRVIRPKVIIAMGGVAGRFLLDESPDAAVGYMRNHDWAYENEVTGFSCPVVVTYHPSYILRNKDENPGRAKEAAIMIMSDLARAIRIAEGW